MDLKFKQNGLRILDSKEGDLLIADPRLDIQLMITSEFLEELKTDPQKICWLGRKFWDFLQKHTVARWAQAQKDLIEIERADKAFVSRLQWRLKNKTIDDLRKIEKDIFFWKKERGIVENKNFKPYEKSLKGGSEI